MGCTLISNGADRRIKRQLADSASVNADPAQWKNGGNRNTTMSYVVIGGVVTTGSELKEILTGNKG